MSLKDTLKALTGKKQASDAEAKNQAIQSIIGSELFPVVRAAEIDITQYDQIPLLGIAALGAAFAQLPTSARTIVNTTTTSMKTKEQLYTLVNPKGIGGYLNLGQNGTSGNIMQINDQGKHVIAGRMYAKPVDGVLPQTTTTATTIPFNPTSMIVAAALIRIEQRLATLQEKVEEVLQYLVLKDQAKQRGNLNMLVEILDEYKQNWDDDKRCSLRNVEVQAIKREAHQSILFHQEQIARKLQDQKMLHGAQQTQGLMKSVMNEFYEYQLACSLYAFASFLDVILQKSFEASSLNAVVEKMREHANRYQELHLACRTQIASHHQTAIESQLLGGIGNIAKTLGQVIASVPVLRDGPVDEALIGAGESLDRFNTENTQKITETFDQLEDSRMHPFIDNIRTLDRLYNRTGSMLLDAQNLYILRTE